MQPRPRQRQPIDLLDRHEPLDVAERDHSDVPPDPPLREHVQGVQPADVKAETQRQLEAVVREAGQDKPHEHQPVPGQCGGKDHIAAADTG